MEVRSEKLESLIAGEQPVVALAHVMFSKKSMSTEIKLERERFLKKLDSLRMDSSFFNSSGNGGTLEVKHDSMGI